MKHRIGAPAHCHIYSKSIAYSIFIEDIFQFEPVAVSTIFGNLTDTSCCFSIKLSSLRSQCKYRTVTRQGDTHCLHQGIHRVCREHTGAAPATRTGIALYLSEFCFIYLTSLKLPHCFKSRCKVDRCAVMHVPGSHWPA